MDLTALLLILLLAVSFGQFLLIISLLSHHHEETPVKAEKIIAKSQEQGRNIIYRAFKRAQEIISDAEVEGLKTSAAGKLRTTQFEKNYEKQLADAVAKSQEQLEKIVSENLSKTMGGYFERLETVVQRIEDEGRKTVGDYRQKQLAAVDEKIVAIVTEVAAKTLGGALSPDTRKDLVYEALEEAKKEKFIS